MQAIGRSEDVSKGENESSILYLCLNILINNNNIWRVGYEFPKVGNTQLNFSDNKIGFSWLHSDTDYVDRYGPYNQLRN